MDQGCSCLPTGVFMGSLDKTKDRFSPDNAFLLFRIHLVIFLH